MSKADERLRRLIDRQTSKVRRLLLDALSGLGAESLNLLTEALEAADVEAALRVAVGDFRVPGLRDALASAVATSASVTSAAFGFTFDLDDPDAVRVAESLAGNAVQGVSRETKQAIRELVVRGFREGIPPRELARQIERIVGLTVRDAGAVSNMFLNLTADGSLTASQVSDRVDAYARRLLRRRAENIARTETINASTQGRRLGWQRAADQGLLNPSTARIIWIVTPDDRLCFPAPTVVATSTGLRPISDIRPGDLVLTPFGMAPVSTVSASKNRKGWVAVRDSAGGLTVATPDHPIWSDGTWIEARDLNPGQPVGYEGIRVVGTAQFDVADTHNPPALLDKLGVPFGILSRIVPVNPVDLKGGLTDSEVDMSAAHWVLLDKPDSESEQRFSCQGFGSGFPTVSEVAATGTEPPRRGRADSDTSFTVGAGQVEGRPSTQLGAMDTAPFGGERCATGSAGDVFGVGPSALEGANGVAVCYRLGDGESLAAARTDLADLALDPACVVATAAAESTLRRLVAAGDTESLAAPLADFVRVDAGGSVVAGGGAEDTAVGERLAAQTAAFLRLCDRIRGGDHLVYDISLVGQNSFFANGLLVHNCSRCAPMAGVTVGFYDGFTSRSEAVGVFDAPGGIVPFTGGTRLLSEFTTVNGPPLHPSCRCDLGLVFGG